MNHLISNDIICFSETWCTTPGSIFLPSFLSNYNLQYKAPAPASKEKSKGRASGGLLLLIRKDDNIQSKIISTGNLWIIVHVKFYSLQLTVGNFYFKPDTFIS